jgi:uncharacterized protein (DUF2164 family)
MALVYANPRWRTETFAKLLRETHEHFDNTDVLLTRVKPYQNYGRRQTEVEAKDLDAKIAKVFHEFVPEGQRWYANGEPKAASAVYRRVVNQVVR